MSDAKLASTPYSAVVRTRSTLTLIEGLGSRLHQIVSPRGAAKTGAWRAAATASAAVDVAKARWLVRDQRFALGGRLALDAADLALWCIAARDDTDTSEDAVIPGVALAAEAGARLGAAGFVVPAVNACVAACVRRRRGHDLRLEQFTWQLMGVAGGAVLTRFARRRRAALEREHDRDLPAMLQTAQLAGLHDVVMINEGAIDVLQRATALVDLGGPAGRRRDFAGAFKADIADAVRAHATYLRDALMVWQTRHNFQPDLHRAVIVELDPQAGTILLTSEQVQRLHDTLDAMDLSGRVAIAPVDATEAARPYGHRNLMVNEAVIALPSAVAERTWRFDAIPTAFLMNICWLLQPTSRQREAVPWSATALPLAMSVGATVWSARRADRDGAASPRLALGLSFASTLTYTIASNLTMRQPYGADASAAEASSRFPWTLALQGYELVRSIVAADLDGPQRSLAAAASVAIVATGWLLAPDPRSARSLAAELQWVAATVIGARHLRHAIRDQADELAASVSADDDRATLAAYRRGRARALATIEAAVTDATRNLEAAQHLDAELRAEAERRLNAARALLAPRIDGISAASDR